MGIDGGITRPQSTIRLDRHRDSHAFTFAFYYGFFLSLFEVYVDDSFAEHTKEARSSSIQSLLTIAILVLHTRTQLALGYGMLNSFTFLSHYLHKVRLDVLITSQR